VKNTWGISGPQFLLIYAGLLVLAGLVVVWGRWVLAKPPVTQPVDPTQLDPYELAVLSGGERLAVTTAIVQLSEAGAVTVRRDPPTIVPSGPLPAGAHPVEQAIYAQGDGVAGRTPGVPLLEAARTPALASLRDRLVRRGLLVRPERARRARMLVVAPGVVLLVGVARLAAGLANGKPVTYLVILLFGALFLLQWVWRRPLRATTQGAAVLRRLRGSDLAAALWPGRRAQAPPILSGGPAFTVALLGAGALWSIDAELAGTLRVPRHGSGWGTGSSGSSGCGGGGGCGGGCGG
jgi:uncharacterized protein (TIGR04222 family)